MANTEQSTVERNVRVVANNVLAYAASLEGNARALRARLDAWEPNGRATDPARYALDAYAATLELAAMDLRDTGDSLADLPRGVA